LTSLSDFKIRNDLQVQKGYLSGRFGAIPFIGGMQDLEKMLDCRQNIEGKENAAQAPAS